jgi:hypothetical protein
MPFGLKNILESEMRLITLSARSIAGSHQKCDVKAPRVPNARNNSNVVILKDWTIGMMQYLHLSIHQWDIHRVSTHIFIFFSFTISCDIVHIFHGDQMYFSSNSRTTNNL